MFKTNEEIVNFIKYENIANIDFKACDIMGKWRHLSIPSSYISEATFKEGFGFDGSNYGFRAVNKSDMLLIPDISTAFIDPFWEQPTISFICNIHEVEDNEARLRQDPRFVCERAEKTLYSLGLGNRLLLGPEFEFYVFDSVAFGRKMHKSFFSIESRQSDWNFEETGIGNFGYQTALKDGYHTEQPYDRSASFRSSLCEELLNMGVRVKYHHHEVGGPGQIELEVDFDTAVSMADISMKIKYAVRNFAIKKGLTASFMPKPMYGAPGSGFHVHFKLMDENKPVFSDDKGYAGMSDTAFSFMAGILVHARALSAIVNPSTNSYKRLVPGYEAPVSLVFGQSNRSAAVRIPGYVKSPEDKRFEYRAGDATANIYLMFASMIMAGIDGIRNKLNPTKMGIGPYDCNIFELPEQERSKIKSLPTNLSEAINALEEDHDFLTYNNVFPEELLKEWIKRKKTEAEFIALQPTPAEYELYYGC